MKTVKNMDLEIRNYVRNEWGKKELKVQSQMHLVLIQTFLKASKLWILQGHWGTKFYYSCSADGNKQKMITTAEERKIIAAWLSIA